MTSGEFDRLALARAKFAFGNFVARSESAVIPVTCLSRGSVIIPGGVFGWYRLGLVFSSKNMHTHICAYTVYDCIFTYIYMFTCTYICALTNVNVLFLGWAGGYE
jgi:hypothetical protein